LFCFLPLFFLISYSILFFFLQQQPGSGTCKQSDQRKYQKVRHDLFSFARRCGNSITLNLGLTW